MNKDKLAKKFYEAHMRKLGASKIAAYSSQPSELQAAWYHVAEIAIANVCKPNDCKPVKRLGDTISDLDSLMNQMQAEHAKALEEAVQNSGALNTDALEEVLEDLRDGIKAAIGAKDFRAVLKLVALKASICGLR